MNAIYDGFNDRTPDAIVQRLGQTLAQGLEKQNKPRFLFRADDIGVPGHNFTRMMELFLEYQVPLCLAVVPTWLTRQRWEALAPFADKGGDLFCWHQHGWRHMNYEVQGKKQEFGPGRPVGDIQNDLAKGKQRLSAVLNHRFAPFFTPPWNRCTRETMAALVNLGFEGISRSAGSHPLPPDQLKEMSVHVDLHTRKDRSPDLGWQALFNEFAQGMESGVCGIMLHHMRMDQGAFLFLESLLRQVAGQTRIEVATFSTLAGKGGFNAIP
ncbi:MAG: polysaccharide deacetylase family protein [Desulfobacterium sp.]|nr:polysaccharide deacetylase family protein [Desulfobacterium sp.]